MTTDANDIRSRYGADVLREAFDDALGICPAESDAPFAHDSSRSAEGEAKAIPSRKTNRRIRLVSFDEIKLGTQRRDLVKGLIPRNGLVLVWGAPKTSKSFQIFDMMMHVALGWNYRGRRVQQGPVVYCAFEGQKGLDARVEAFRQAFLAEHNQPVPFYVEPVNIDLVKENQDLISEIRETLGNANPSGVVLDTLNRSLAGSESSDADMAGYIRAADTIREAFDCAVVIVHHCGIDGTRPRGHTSQTGAADVQLSVKREGDAFVMTVELAKDSPQGDTIISRLQQVEVGTDEDGDPITSCVVVPVEYDEISPRTPKAKLSDRQKLALDALRECIISAGTPAPGVFELSRNTNTVPIEMWRAQMLSRRVIDPNGKNPRQDFKRLHEQLQAKQLIGIRDDVVWLAI